MSFDADLKVFALSDKSVPGKSLQAQDQRRNARMKATSSRDFTK